MLHIIDGNNRFRARWEKLGPDALQIMYHDSIQKNPNTKTIWVWDGEYAKASRQEIFPEYKGMKAPASDQFHETMNFFRQLLNHSNCLQLCVPGYEADDVIAMLAKDSDEKVLIDSNDADFLALVDDRVTVERDPLPNTAPHYVHLYKTLVGDKSDGIGGLTRFGEGGWAKLEDSERNLLIKHFTNEERLTGQDCKELFGWTKGLAEKWDNDLDKLDIFWKVTEFIPVPFELIHRHLTFGSLDMARANIALQPYLLTMDHEKVAVK